MAAVRLELGDELARLIFCDGARGNPIDGQFCAEFCEAAIVASTASHLRALLITAEGPNFSFGGDINAFVADLDALPQNIKRWTTTLHSAIARLQSMDAPIVVAVHGVCAGGMSALVAGCDFVLAADSARFVAAYTGIGYSCDAGASIMYARRMGLARTRKFLLLNETLDAVSAQAAGLVDDVMPGTGLLGAAENLAAKLARGPTRAFGEIRRLLLSADRQPLEAQLELEALALARIGASADAREGLTAFSEKRKPAFRGE
jgi:2-(1,2-epoxy-1,2-dihydrophenyl)acetyl-CoA isomerase